jgi:hypothetical protein
MHPVDEAVAPLLVGYRRVADNSQLWWEPHLEAAIYIISITHEDTSSVVHRRPTSETHEVLEQGMLLKRGVYLWEVEALLETEEVIARSEQQRFAVNTEREEAKVLWDDQPVTNVRSDLTGVDDFPLLTIPRTHTSTTTAEDGSFVLEHVSATPGVTTVFLETAQTIADEDLKQEVVAALTSDEPKDGEGVPEGSSGGPKEPYRTSRFFRQLLNSTVTEGMLQDSSIYMSPLSMLEQTELSLTESQQRVPFDIYAPAHLPERLQNPQLYVLQGGLAAVTAYAVGEGDQQRTPLAFMQDPADADLPPLPVGVTPIMQFDTGEVIAEMVQGNWVASEHDGELRWDARHPALWVVWEQDGFIFTLVSRDFVINQAALPNLINSFRPIPVAATDPAFLAGQLGPTEVTQGDAPLSGITLLSPAPGAKVGGFLALRWAPVPAGVTYQVTVTRNDTGEVVHQSSTGGVMA